MWLKQNSSTPCGHSQFITFTPLNWLHSPRSNASELPVALFSTVVVSTTPPTQLSLKLPSSYILEQVCHLFHVSAAAKSAGGPPNAHIIRKSSRGAAGDDH